MSPTRSSRRLADRAAKKLCFNNPLTQTITTERYIKSHVDLLAEEASPYSATDSEAEGSETLDLAMAYTGDETRDGGQTPGPFEEMRRRMAGLGADGESETPGNKKSKRKEKKRQWVWTIGVNEDEVEDVEPSPVISSRSESPETLIQVQDTAAMSQAENLERSPVSTIQIPSEASGEGPVTAAPVTTKKFPSEAIDKAPMAATSQWPEVPKCNLVTVKIQELPEPLAPVMIFDSSGDTEMIDRPGTSHSM
jgi:hypothetical protein